MEFSLSVKWTAGEVSVYRTQSALAFSPLKKKKRGSPDKVILSHPQLHPVVCCAMIGSGNTAASLSATSVLLCELGGLGKRDFIRGWRFTPHLHPPRALFHAIGWVVPNLWACQFSPRPYPPPPPPPCTVFPFWEWLGASALQRKQR